MENTGAQPATPTDAKTADPKQPGIVPQGGAKPEANAVQAAAAEAKRKLKIDNEEIDEDEVIKTYRERKGHQRAANKELQEGRAAKKQAEEFIAMMKDKQKLFDAIKKLGHDPRQLSEEYLAQVLEHEMLDPKEKEIKELRTKLMTHEEKEKAAREEAEKAKADALRKTLAEKYTAEFVDALKQTNLPPTKEMVAEMAKYIQRASKIKFEMTALEAAKLVQQDEDARIERRLKNATPEQIIQILKEEGLQKVRGYDTSRLKDPAAHLKTPSGQVEQPTRERKPGTKRMTPEEWREFNRK